MTSLNNDVENYEVPPARVLCASIFGAETSFSLTVALYSESAHPIAPIYLLKPRFWDNSEFVYVTLPSVGGIDVVTHPGTRNDRRPERNPI